MATAYPNAPGVQFKDIPDHPGYCVGDDGSVWSSKRPARGLGSSGWSIGNPWRQLMPMINKDGYLFVSLSNQKHYMVHRLVLISFVGPCPDKHECCHFPNRDRSDNRLCNLRWGTRVDNRKDSDTHKTLPRGEHNQRSVLTEKQVLEIRKEYNNLKGYKKLSEKYNVSRMTIWNIVRRKTWIHITLFFSFGLAAKLIELVI